MTRILPAIVLGVTLVVALGAAPRGEPQRPVTPAERVANVPSDLAVASAGALRGAPLGPIVSGVPQAELRGLATWYDAPSKQDAAAGPALRHALGKGWRNTWVRVMHGSQTVTVLLSDWCACGSRHGQPTLLDLDDQAFRDLGPLSAGVITVSVERVDGVPTRLPNTDTE